MSEHNHSIKGSWMGTYYYDGLQQPNSFEAVFVESAGAVEGSILDDGQLGEAKVTGSFTYPALSFVKRYFNSRYLPIKYDGSMDAEGNKLTGHWRIDIAAPAGSGAGGTSGTWHAWRINGEEEDEEVGENRVEVESEMLVPVRRRSRPRTQTQTS